MIDPLLASADRCRDAAHAVGVAHEELEAADAVVRAATERKSQALAAYHVAWADHRALIERPIRGDA